MFVALVLNFNYLLLRPVRERHIAISLSVRLRVCVCLYASISLEPLDRSSRNFVAVVRSSSGGVAIRYVLLVLWMTSRLAVMARIAMRGRLTLNLLPL